MLEFVFNTFVTLLVVIDPPGAGPDLRGARSAFSRQLSARLRALYSLP